MEISPFTTQHHFYNISKYKKKPLQKVIASIWLR